MPVLRLRHSVEKLRTLARILVATIQAFDLDLERRRIPDGTSKALLVRALQRGRDVLRLRPALAVIGLSSARRPPSCDVRARHPVPRLLIPLPPSVALRAT